MSFKVAASHPDKDIYLTKLARFLQLEQSPYRLVVRTSRCGRDNPGSTPGEDILKLIN